MDDQAGLEASPHKYVLNTQSFLRINSERRCLNQTKLLSFGEEAGERQFRLVATIDILSFGPILVIYLYHHINIYKLSSDEGVGVLRPDESNFVSYRTWSF